MSTVLRPSSPLKIVTDSSGQGTPDTTADELVVENSGNAGISILTPDTGVGRISFGDVTENNSGGMSYDHSTDTLAFFTDGNQQRFSFDGNGRFLINTPTGGLTTKVEIDDSIGLLDAAGGDVDFIGEVDNGAFASLFLRESSAAGNGMRYDATNNWAEIYGVNTGVNTGNPFPIIRFDRDGERISFHTLNSLGDNSQEIAKFANSALELVDGTALAPAYTFTSDLDTGLYLAGAGDLATTVGGTAITHTTSAGLGIGQSNVQADLHIGGGTEIIWTRTGAGTNNENWRLNIDATGDWALTTREDDFTFGQNVWQIERTGVNIDYQAFFAEGNDALRLVNEASAVNYLQASGSATGNGVSITAAGTDSDIDLVLVPKGAGVTQVSGDFTTTGRIEDVEIGNYYESTVDLGTGLSGTVTLDLTNGNVFHGSFSGATTFAVSTVPTSGLTATLTIYLTDTSGAPSYTWPSGTLWPGGSEPSWTANGTDVVTLSTRDNGTTWYGLPVAFGMA